MPSGVIFEEIECKSIINRVQATGMPFKWSINPYRGCQHACVYCFARGTHEYLGYNAGEDFNRRIVVKVNLVEVLRRYRAGEQVVVHFYRDGSEVETDVTLGARPN